MRREHAKACSRRAEGNNRLPTRSARALPARVLREAAYQDEDRRGSGGLQEEGGVEFGVYASDRCHST
jgi:hypothetical protein